jgi:3-phenylpropionate/cinnamic acid dioxygenase small subunit
MTSTKEPPVDEIPDLSRNEIEEFLFREARLADENDYDAWEDLWTDDAIYWVPAGDDALDPTKVVSVIYDNRSRIATRLKQVRTGKRYAQTPVSDLRRLISNIEITGTQRSLEGLVDTEVQANFLLMESRTRGVELWAGRTTYRLRRVEGQIRLVYKKVVLVNGDKALPTLGFLI